MNVVSKKRPLQHYNWGEGCDGWTLVDEPSLTVKQERMPAGTTEIKHYHQNAQQFFFILKGTATFEIDRDVLFVKTGEGLHVPAGTKHKISNQEADVLEFVLCSQPSTKSDRINCG